MSPTRLRSPALLLLLATCACGGDPFEVGDAPDSAGLASLAGDGSGVVEAGEPVRDSAGRLALDGLAVDGRVEVDARVTLLPEASSGADAPGEVDAPSAADAAAEAAPTCSALLATDPQNCGACGHVCPGGIGAEVPYCGQFGAAPGTCTLIVGCTSGELPCGGSISSGCYCAQTHACVPVGGGCP